MIRPAVEAALEVARLGLLANPPVDPPPRLRRYLGFAKLSPATLRAIALVVDSDEEFRTRTTAGTDENEVGRAGWLWLTRPEGWIDEVARLQEEADAAASASAAERSERSARRKLKTARAAADKAAAKARARAEELDQLRADLADERARRSAAEAEMDKLRAELERAGEERFRAVRELKDAEARLAERARQANEALARIRELERQAIPERLHEAPHGVVANDAPEGLLGDPALAEALSATASGALTLGEALSQLAALLEQASVADATSTGRRTGAAATDPRRIAGTDVVWSGWQPVSAPREPVTLPSGVAAGSVEAVAHLFKTPGVLVLVDGYNVTMAGWPELPIADQRARLLSALDEAAARRGADVEVIFDGADVEPVAALLTGRQSVRKRFSPPDVEADDVLLGLLAQIPTSRPVVVVSSDNRVREGARLHGANLVHGRQLLDVLRH